MEENSNVNSLKFETNDEIKKNLDIENFNIKLKKIEEEIENLNKKILDYNKAFTFSDILINSLHMTENEFKEFSLLSLLLSKRKRKLRETIRIFKNTTNKKPSEILLIEQMLKKDKEKLLNLRYEIKDKIIFLLK